MLKVLDVGSGSESVAAVVFQGEDMEIVRCDIDGELRPDLLHDITEPFPEEHQGIYDLVYCSHVLEHVSRTKIIITLKNLASALRPGGELWVIVPALEWAARELLKDDPSPVVIPFIYGSQHTPHQYHHSGFTLNTLRQLFVIAGLIPRRAYQADFTITTDSREWQALQNIVVGARPPQE